jgi:quinol monooxygenase YgiN
MLVLHSKYTLDPDNRERALELIEDLVAASREEDGVLGYDAAIEVGNPDVVHFFDQYRDEAALGEHAAADHVERFERELPALLAAEPEITQFTVESRAELDAEVGVDDD